MRNVLGRMNRETSLGIGLLLMFFGIVLGEYFCRCF